MGDPFDYVSVQALAHKKNTSLKQRGPMASSRTLYALLSTHRTYNNIGKLKKLIFTIPDQKNNLLVCTLG